MRQKIAIIDQGSMSTKLQIIESCYGVNTTIHNEKFQTKLAEGLVTNQNNISVLSLNNTIKSLHKIKETIKLHNPDRIEVFSTEALRQASNASDVIENIYYHTGFNFRVISQEQELKLFWHALTEDFKTDEIIAAVDIGGASVQFMYGTKNKLLGSLLLKTGILVLKDKYIKNDPATLDEISAIENHIKQEIAKIDFKFDKKTHFIHGSGSVLNFYQELGMNMSKYKHSKNHPYKIKFSDIRKFYDETKLLPHQNRVKFTPLQPDFAEGLHIASANVLCIAEKCGFSHIVPSNRSLGEGMINLILSDKFNDFLDNG